MLLFIAGRPAVGLRGVYVVSKFFIYYVVQVQKIISLICIIANSGN